ncbi:HigA family addiction module antitoxin [Demequina sp. NBRC 110056]|uniref:HigA family addiction module antitoxin n=1 Tax=Demequina sp. NBRC 110056 TaxID=1570345 RepID=UPI0009FE4536|nr:HigA family addiction module antitoxin [Demequina sp. NBRC 110056]
MTTLKKMHNPPHPGEIIAEIYLAELGMSGRELAQRLSVAPSTLARVLNGSNRVSPEMALRLSTVLGGTAESWLAMQDAHDLWVARQTLDLSPLRPLEAASA